MDASSLRAIAAHGETYTVEFKRGRQPHDLSDSDIVEAAMCLANGDGGLLCLGIDDDGTITGLAKRHGDRTDPDRIAALLLNLADPPIAASVELVVVDGLDVVAIEVPKATTPVGMKSGLYKRRSLRLDGRPECVPYRPQEMLSAGFSMTGRDYAEVVLPDATYDDLDPVEFDRFRRGARSQRGDDALIDSGNQEILRALRLVNGESGVTIGAVLLFGTSDALARFIPTAECLFQEFNGRDLTVNESLRHPLLRAADELYERLRIRNSEYEVMLGLHRVSVPRIPDSTAREAIVNALIHRDYTENGPIRVQLSVDELTVASPGGFPPGVTLDNLIVESRPRSAIIAAAFKRAGLVDRAGRGIPEMYLSLLRAGRSGPDFTRSTDRSVTVSIPTGGADLDMVRFILNYEEEHQSYLTLDPLRILHEIKAMGPSSVTDLTSGLRLLPSTTRAALSQLTQMGLLEDRGNGRNRRFHLSAAFYRIAEDRSAYVRVRGIDPLQQEQMVMSYIETYGRVTRAEVAKLCLMSSPEARLLLMRLRDEGKIEMCGAKRGAYYIKPSPQG
ncbi:MAG: putative DNA binding domain-containing protein [Propionibacteriaceae bacterium]|nr:putative DNA binding domain-containing protein [Propionibacteriaceae bacterium]